MRPGFRFDHLGRMRLRANYGHGDMPELAAEIHVPFRHYLAARRLKLFGRSIQSGVLRAIMKIVKKK